MPVPVHPVATVLGDIPLAVNVPSFLVVTDAKLAAPVPVNVTVFPPIPILDEATASFPVTFTVVLHGTLAIVFNVSVVVVGVVRTVL